LPAQADIPLASLEDRQTPESFKFRFVQIVCLEVLPCRSAVGVSCLECCCRMMCIVRVQCFRVAVVAQTLAMSIQVVVKLRFATLEPGFAMSTSPKHAKALHSSDTITRHSPRSKHAAHGETNSQWKQLKNPESSVDVNEAADDESSQSRRFQEPSRRVLDADSRCQASQANDS
jgi:hypothetical protein